MEDHGDAKAEGEGGELGCIVERGAHLGELAALREDEAREVSLLLARESRHVRVGEDVSRVLVVGALRDGHADLVQLRSPIEEGCRRFARVGGDVAQQPPCELGNALGLRGVDVVAVRELLHGHVADVAVVHAPEEVPEDAVAQRPFGDRHLIEVELGEDAGHDRRTSGDHRHAVLAQPVDRDLLQFAGAEQLLAQPREAVGVDAARREPVLLQDLRERARRARRADRLLPADLLEARGDRLHLLARGDLGLLHALLLDAPAGEEARGVADASHVEALHRFRAQLVADDDLGRSAADIDDEAVVVGERQRMHDAEIDEARFLAPRDHLDREAERALRLAHELRGILRDPQRIRADRAHRAARHSREPLAEALERGERALLHAFVELLLAREPRAQAHRFLEGVERIDLLAVDATDREMEAVGSEVDRAEGGIFHCGVGV